MNQLPINYSAILGKLSYGIVGLNFLKQLDALGLKVCLFPIGIEPEIYQENQDLINRCLQNADSYSRHATSLRIQQQYDLATHVGKGRHISFPIFELNRFTQRELIHLRSQDKLVVCSDWAKQILLENNILNDIDIHVVPLGVDRSIFYENPPNFFRNEPRRTRFINVSKWEIRKGHYELLDYFESAFTPDDDVELIMVTGSVILEQRMPQEVEKWKRMYAASPMAHKIKIVDWLPTQKAVADLLRLSDCYISLSKAEGFGLGALEAMSCGLEVIITECTAHKQFITNDNSYQVSVGDLELALDNVFFNGQSGGQWHSLNDQTKANCVDWMKWVHDRKQNGSNLLNTYGIETAKQFSWENAVRKLVEIL
jgi:glycosyltransferase involved in cell wall biosynthesis